MGRNGLLTSIAVLTAAICCSLAPSASAADAPTKAEAKKAAKAAVMATTSYQQIDSPFRLKTRGCSRNADEVTCVLYRSVSQACKLNGTPAPGAVCSMVVAHRAWTVTVTNQGATINSQADVVGKFKPEPVANTARRRR